MLGVALKVSASDESTGLPPVKLTPQAVGLLALLGLSGVAVILTLSKQKRWHCLFDSTQTTSGSLATLASDFYSSLSTPSVDDRSTTDVRADDSLDSSVEELSEVTSCRIGDSRARTGISFAVTSDDPSCDKRAPEMLTCAGEVAAVLPAQPLAPSPTEAVRVCILGQDQTFALCQSTIFALVLALSTCWWSELQASCKVKKMHAL